MVFNILFLQFKLHVRYAMDPAEWRPLPLLDYSVVQIRRGAPGSSAEGSRRVADRLGVWSILCASRERSTSIMEGSDIKIHEKICFT